MGDVPHTHPHGPTPFVLRSTCCSGATTKSGNDSRTSKLMVIVLAAKRYPSLEALTADPSDDSCFLLGHVGSLTINGFSLTIDGWDSISMSHRFSLDRWAPDDTRLAFVEVQSNWPLATKIGGSIPRTTSKDGIPWWFHCDLMGSNGG